MRSLSLAVVVSSSFVLPAFGAMKTDARDCDPRSPDRAIIEYGHIINNRKASFPK